MKTTEIKAKAAPQAFPGMVHCPICTHSVPGTVLASGRTVKVAPGQKCPRCSSMLDVAVVLQFRQAA
jgi:hypothetical protein